MTPPDERTRERNDGFAHDPAGRGAGQPASELPALARIAAADPDALPLPPGVRRADPIPMGPSLTRAQVRANEIAECGARLNQLLDAYECSIRVTRTETVGPDGGPQIRFLTEVVTR